MNRSRLTHSQAAIHEEVERLLAVLRHRPNRDKLSEQKFFLASSLLERWRWNSSVISDSDLREFVLTARELVSEVEVANRKLKQNDT